VTTPVGQYSPAGDSPEGCADIAGNVWEWTASWFQPYPGSSYRHEGYGRKYRVLRGGSFDSYGVYARVAVRSRYNPTNWRRIGGFRVGCGGAAPSSPLAPSTSLSPPEARKARPPGGRTGSESSEP
jgi:formylglycine-generating enzyme required for sulfatase activity